MPTYKKHGRGKGWHGQREKHSEVQKRSKMLQGYADPHRQKKQRNASRGDSITAVDKTRKAKYPGWRQAEESKNWYKEVRRNRADATRNKPHL